jgi:hypothetical protein
VRETSDTAPFSFLPTFFRKFNQAVTFDSSVRRAAERWLYLLKETTIVILKVPKHCASDHVRKLHADT